MKRTAFAVFLISIVVIAGATWVILSQTENQVENQTYDVKIAEFKWTRDWGTPAGVAADREFNVTIQNLENRNITGLTVEVEMFDANGSELESATAFFGAGIIGESAEIEPFDGVLHAGEVRTLRGIIMTNWGEIGRANALGSITTLAEVKFGSTLLDELKVT